MLLEALADVLSKNFVSKDVKQKRLSECAKCPHKEVILGVDNCNQCHCILNWKTAMPRESCPINKWSVVESTKD